MSNFIILLILFFSFILGCLFMYFFFNIKYKKLEKELNFVKERLTLYSIHNRVIMQDNC